MIDDPALLSFLQSEEQNALDTALDAQRAAALELYQGLPFGNEVEGRSQLVTRDVAEVADAYMASLLRVMFSGDKVVDLVARSQADAEKVNDASELIDYQFMRSQEGYLILHDWIKEGILEKTGVIKTWVERRNRDVEMEAPGELLTSDGADGVMLDGKPVVASEQINADEVIEDEFGFAQPAPEVFRVTVREPMPPKFMDAVVPNEEFRVAADARDLDSAVYICHRTAKSLSQLREMGFEFDGERVWGDNTESRIISDARDADRSKRDDQDQRRGAMRKVWLSEEYVLYDQNEDGVAERLCVHRVGTTILSVVEVDEHPFEEWCPFPMTARRVGQSVADKTADIQVVNSTLLRQGMDSLYMSTNPRTLVHEDAIGENTIDDLLTVRSGGLIRWQGANAPAPWATLPVHEQAFQGIEAMTAMRESRTGVTRMNQGLDADLFNRTSATGTIALQNAGQQMQEYVARNFVQSGLARLFAKKYRLYRKFGVPTELMVDGQARVIDPREWPEEFDIQIRVGLGTNNKDALIQRLSALLETQVEGIQNGSPLVDWNKIYNTSRQLVQAMNVGSPSDYLINPQDAPPQEQSEQPDPAVIEAQSKAMSEQAEQQRKTMKQQADIQADAETRSVKARIAEEDAAHSRQLQNDRAAFEANLAVERQQFEQGIALDRLAFDKQLAKERMESSNDDEPATPGYRSGGDLAR